MQSRKEHVDLQAWLPPARPDWQGIGSLISGTWREVFTDHRNKSRDSVPDASEDEPVVPTTYPWIFSRFLAYSIAGFAIVMLYIQVTQDFVLLPIAVFLGAAGFPVTIVLFLWECNFPNNITLRRLALGFILGGVGASMILGLLSTSAISASDAGRFVIVTATMAGMVVLAIVSARGLTGAWLLNGAVLGSTVGAGFLVVERFWLWLGWGSEFFQLGFLVNLVVQYSWTGLVNMPVWIAIAASGLWLASHTEGRITWAAVFRPASFVPLIGVRLLSYLDDQTAVLGISSYPAAVVLWVLLGALGIYVLLTYVVSGINQFQRSSPPTTPP